MAKLRTKEDFDSLPWAEIRKRSKTESIKSIFDHLVKPLGKCGLTTFRQWCVVKHIHSPFSEDTKKQFTEAGNAKKAYSAKEDQQIMKMLLTTPRKTYRQIGERLGRSPAAIEARAKRLQKSGKMPERRLGWKKTEEAMLIDFLRQDPPLTHKEIGDKLGRSSEGVRRHIYEMKEAGIFPDICAKKKKEKGPNPQVTASMNALNWDEVIAWTDAAGNRTQKIARMKFCKPASQAAFNARMAIERKRINASKPTILIMPVAQHKQLKPMWGQSAA